MNVKTKTKQKACFYRTKMIGSRRGWAVLVGEKRHDEHVFVAPLTRGEYKKYAHNKHVLTDM